MVTTLLIHSWLKFTRSVGFTKELTVTIFLGIMGLLVMMYALILGFNLDVIITKGLNIPDSFAFLNKFLLYYFISEFIMRYMIQKTPVLEIQPYLHLPMKKPRIMHFLLLRSLFHILNIFVLLLFVPFAFKVVAPQYGLSGGWEWLLSIWLTSLCIHYIVIIFKKKLDDSFWGILSIVLFFSAIAAADYYNWFKFSDVSASLFLTAATSHAVLTIAAILVVVLYSVNHYYFLEGVYSDESSKNITKKTHDFIFLHQLGGIGEWINLELKLILRNKRPRTVLYMSAIFLAYGLIFYSKESYSGMSWFIILMANVITGIFMINYGQFLYSWQASHFDFTLTRPVSLRQYIESKYWLMNTVTVLCFLLSLPYAYFGWKIILNHAMLMLFNMGVNVFIILNMAMWEPKKLNLTKGGYLNYEGVGAAQWVMGLPLFISPFLIYIPFSLAGQPTIGILAIGVVGTFGIVFRSYLLDITTRRLEKRRYSIAEGFRKEN